MLGWPLLRQRQQLETVGVNHGNSELIYSVHTVFCYSLLKQLLFLFLKFPSTFFSIFFLLNPKNI